VIGKVCKRGSDVRRLLGYCSGRDWPGNGLTAPHMAARLIAGWEGTAGLEPAVTAGGGRDLRRLVAALNAPLLAAGLERQEWKNARPVYHLAISAADEDPHLSDEQWADIAAEYVDRIGLAARGDDRAVRWVAVRHADNHVHVVATLARADGRRIWPRNDFYRSREASLDVESPSRSCSTAGRREHRAPTPTSGGRVGKTVDRSSARSSGNAPGGTPRSRRARRPSRSPRAPSATRPRQRMRRGRHPTCSPDCSPRRRPRRRAADLGCGGVRARGP